MCQQSLHPDCIQSVHCWSRPSSNEYIERIEALDERARLTVSILIAGPALSPYDCKMASRSQYPNHFLTEHGCKHAPSIVPWDRISTRGRSLPYVGQYPIERWLSYDWQHCESALSSNS